MTKVVWLGEDTEQTAGPSFNVWNGIKFPKGVAVEVTNQHMLGKARINQYFKVIEQEESHGESQTQEQVKEQTEKEQSKDKGTGYSPVKKKVRKKKPPAEDKSATAA